MKKLALIAVTLLALASCKQKDETEYEYPFRNPNLKVEQRVEDLLSRLTLREKVGMTMSSSFSVDRLGIPAYTWWSEACHGITGAGVTVFPQSIGLAASFDTERQFEIYTAVSDEARARWNSTEHNEFGVDSKYCLDWWHGLSFWCPNVNIFRDPRWGRGQETSGEDPFLAGEMGAAVVRGMQGDNDRYFKTIACAKHFAVHSGPESTRHSFDARVSQRDLWETYLPAFKKLVDAGVQQVMGAYNRYEGEPCCASNRLLVDILRGKWNYQGFVVSDCGAIENFYEKGRHETHPDAATASAAAVKAGCDVECGTSYDSLSEAVEKGYITEAEIDVSLRRILSARIRLGMLDPVELDPWKELGADDLSTEKNHELARKSAQETMVLLKNNGILPLSRNLKKIAVIGPNADNSYMHLGNYNGTPTDGHTLSIVDAIRQAAGSAEIIYNKGCENIVGKGEEEVNFSQMQSQIADADVIIAVTGLTAKLEGEEMSIDCDGFYRGDRTAIELPEVQQNLVRAARQTGKPVVVVNCSGSAIAFGPIEKDYDALLQAWYGGQAAGLAVADVLFGDYNPAGRLPVTFYESTSQLPSDLEDYNMEGKTYRYFRGTPLYAFGYGLSYTTFEYGEAKVKGSKHKVTVPVTNTGSIDGDEVVQIYVKALDNPEAPIKSLKGFKRVNVPAGKTVSVTIELGDQAFEFYNPEVDGLRVAKGRYKILYGGSSRDEDLKSIDITI
ncbi:MAG: glycoside hydrolase family 3 C-terminal domain-containing protein [Bacteroidales bacterium]|nr:glycoside hydrolase family 3 C-terminal domain-containing protein [Candidatus Cacconaster scatequi]